MSYYTPRLCIPSSLFITGLLACSPGAETYTPFNTGDGGSSSAATSDVPGTTAPAVTSSDEEGTSDAGPKLDVGSVNTTGEQDFCNAVDILFVIDNSLSMGDYQSALALSWPSFVNAMWKNLPNGTDLHVGMTTTDFYAGGSCSEFIFNCETTASDGAVQDHYTPPTEASTGNNGEQGRLFEHEGLTYFQANVGDDPVPLKDWFSGAAVAAGEGGCSFEMSSAAAGYAFHPANDVANAGFLRDEGSVLVVIVLTDEPDKSPEGSAVYRDMILDAKSGCGGDQCVIVTGIVDQCIEGVDNELNQFFNEFTNFTGTGSIDDALGYVNVVGSALAEVIGQTCEQIPAG